MQSQFSPPPTRLDAVLWFLRVQLWLTVAALFTGSQAPYFGFWGMLNVQHLATFGLSILVLSLFPRLLAQSALGPTARYPLGASDLRALAKQCVGLALFVSSLGRAILVVVALGLAFWDGRNSSSSTGFGMASYASTFLLPQFVGTTLTLVLGFFLAFGPSIRASVRSYS